MEQKEENNNSSSDEALRSRLCQYLPVVNQMKLKTAGTALEIKFQMLYDSIVEPKITLTMGKLQNIENMIISLMEIEGFKNRNTAKLSEEKLREMSTSADNEACNHKAHLAEHSYASANLQNAQKSDDSETSSFKVKRYQRRQLENNPSLSISRGEERHFSAGDDRRSKETDEEKSPSKNTADSTEQATDYTEYQMDLEDSTEQPLINSKVPMSSLVDFPKNLSDQPISKEPTKGAEIYSKSSMDSEDIQTATSTDPSPLDPSQTLRDSTAPTIDSEEMTSISLESSINSKDQQSKSEPSPTAETVEEQQSESEKVRSEVERTQSIPIGPSNRIRAKRQSLAQRYPFKLKKRNQKAHRLPIQKSLLSSEQHQTPPTSQVVTVEPNPTQTTTEQRTTNRKRKRSMLDEDEDEFRGWDRSEVEKDDSVNISYQSSPTLPAAPALLWSFESICHIAFAKTRRGFAYKCLVPECNFQTLLKVNVKFHIEKKHKDVTWDKYCESCSRLVRIKASGGTIFDEYKHLDRHQELSSGLTSSQHDVTSAKVLSEETIQAVPSNSIANKTTSPNRNLPKLPACISFKVIAADKGSTAAGKVSSEVNVDEPAAKKIEAQPSKQTVNVRPWTKNECFIAEELLTDSLATATYKCMRSYCAKFSNDSTLFRHHLNTNHKSDRPIDRFNCAHCSFVGKSADELIAHVDTDHQYDKFQCVYCFYRSCSVSNVLKHQEIFHAGKALQVLQCPQLQEIESSNGLKLARKNLGENVLPIVCVFCRGIFFSMKVFIDHVSSHDESLKARCIKCSGIVTKTTLQKHLEPCLSIGKFQCVYCLKGTNGMNTLFSHLANEHPSLMPIFFSRDTGAVGSEASPSIMKPASLKLLKHPALEHIERISSTVSKNEVKPMQRNGAKRFKSTRVVASMPPAAPLISASSFRETMEHLLKEL